MMMCRCNVIPQRLGGVRKRSVLWRCSRLSHSACSTAGNCKTARHLKLFLILGGGESRREKFKTHYHKKLVERPEHLGAGDVGGTLSDEA